MNFLQFHDATVDPNTNSPRAAAGTEDDDLIPAENESGDDSQVSAVMLTLSVKLYSDIWQYFHTKIAN